MLYASFQIFGKMHPVRIISDALRLGLNVALQNVQSATKNTNTPHIEYASGKSVAYPKIADRLLVLKAEC